MKEINWKAVAEQFQITPAELESQVIIAACAMADMQLDGSNCGMTVRYTCQQLEYNLELTVRRIEAPASNDPLCPTKTIH